MQANNRRLYWVYRAILKRCVNGRQTQTHGFEWAKDTRRAERTCRMVDCSTYDTCVVNRVLSNGNVMSMEFGYKQCSECGAYVFDCPTVLYCPNCGARVIGEETGDAD